MGLFSRRPVVPVLRLSGPIGLATPLRPGLTLAGVAPAIERAFRMRRAAAVALSINSPGGSAVQSRLIHDRIRALAEETGKRVYVFTEDVAASGGYMLALAGDEIYADACSVVGSIGVIAAGFGFHRLIEKWGIERRVHTAGERKLILDPFQPEKPEDVAKLEAIQKDIHQTFIAMVRERRAARLKGDDETLFSGAFWTASEALELGLIDGLGDIRSRMRALFGEKVRLKLVSPPRALFARRLRLPGTGIGMGLGTGVPPAGGAAEPASLGADLLSTLEARALWARYGL